MIYYSYLPDMSKSEIRGTFSFMTALQSPLRIGSAFLYGFWEPSEWPYYLAAFGVSVLGLVFGTKAHRYVDGPTIILILLVLVFAASASLVPFGFDNLGIAMIAIFGTATLVSLGFLLSVLYVRRKRRRAQAQLEPESSPLSA